MTVPFVSTWSRVLRGLLVLGFWILFVATLNGGLLTTASAQVGEPGQDFRVQRGSVTVTGSSTTLTAGVDYEAPATTSRAFVRITNTLNTGSGSTTDGSARDVTVYIANPADITETITFARPSGATSSTRVAWEMLEYTGVAGGDNEMVVRQHNTITFATDGLVATSTAVAGVESDAQVAIFITGQSNPDTGTNYQRGNATAEWVSATQAVRFTRGANGVQAGLSYTVVEFTGPNWSVQRSEHTYTSAGTTETESITAVASLRRAFLHTQKRMGANQDTHADFGHEIWLSGIGQVSYRLDPDVTTPTEHTSVAWVIENRQSVGQTMNVTRSDGTQSGGPRPTTVSVPIGTTVQSLDTASLFFTNRGSGSTTTTFPEPLMSGRIASTTAYELFIADTNDSRTWRSEVVEWPTAQPILLQSDYRFYVDNDALTPSDPYPPGGTDLGENMAITDSDEPPGVGDQLRIRLGVRVKDATLPSDTQDFKLQYGQRTTSCTDVSDWVDVAGPGGETDWRGVDGSPTSGVALSNDPPDSGDLLLSGSDRAGTYQESNPTPTNPYDVNAGEVVEYDWHIEHNGATQDQDYCFRMVTSEGTSFSDYEVYPTVRTAAFAPEITNWRWYDDPENETPTSPRAGEEAAPSDLMNTEVFKLRVQASELQGATGENVKFALQFSEYSDFQDGGTILRPANNCAENDLWCYADGAGADNATITSAVLTGTDACASGVGVGCGTHNTAATTSSSFTHTADAVTEYEFTLQHAGARANAVYYFRLYDVGNDRPVQASSSLPSAVTEGAQLQFTTYGLPSGTTTAGVTTDVSTTPTAVNFTDIPLNQSYFAAHRLDISTNATDGYKLFMYTDQDPTNSYGDPIAPIAATNATPDSWSNACDLTQQDSCFGYHTTDATLEGGSTRFSALDTYAALDTSPQEVMYSPVPVSDVHDIVYQIAITGNQPAGDYQASMTFIAVPVF